MSDDLDDSPARIRMEDANYVRQGRMVAGLIVLLGIAFIAWMLFGLKP